MKVYHQLGFRENWNIECFEKGIGDGLIYSPVNIDASKLKKLDYSLKETSFLDPQLYLLNIAKKTLSTYPYFPSNIKANFSTIDLSTDSSLLAESCINFQIENNFKYIVIPVRYFDDNPKSYLSQQSQNFIYPFYEYVNKNNIKNKILASVVIKSSVLADEDKLNETLNWITGLSIDGVYLIFENSFTSKQIKDFNYLFNALKLIQILKDNEMEVHIGYCNTESILYSIAMPDSISMGSYENLRSFSIKRFKDAEEGKKVRTPNARLYSSKLLQWVDYNYIQAMKKLLPDLDNFIDDSNFKPLMFAESFNWHFSKPELYKHFFYVFYSQVKNLPINISDRINEVQIAITNSISLFNIIKSNKILLDENSDGSHLPI